MKSVTPLVLKKVTTIVRVFLRKAPTKNLILIVYKNLKFRPKFVQFLNVLVGLSINRVQTISDKNPTIQ